MVDITNQWILSTIIFVSDTQYNYTHIIINIHIHMHFKHTHHCPLSTASPKPGVSTTVNLSLTPLSSMSTVNVSMFTVCTMRSIHRRASTPVVTHTKHKLHMTPCGLHMHIVYGKVLTNCKIKLTHTLFMDTFNAIKLTYVPLADG